MLLTPNRNDVSGENVTIGRTSIDTSCLLSLMFSVSLGKEHAVMKLAFAKPMELNIKIQNARIRDCIIFEGPL